MTIILTLLVIWDLALQTVLFFVFLRLMDYLQSLNDHDYDE